MILFICAVIIAAIGIAMLIFMPKTISYSRGGRVNYYDSADTDTDNSDNADTGYPAKKLALIPLGISVLMLMAGSFYTQDPGEAVVVKSISGSVVNVDTTSGFGFKLPWTSKVSFDIRNQRIEMFTNAGGQGDDGAAINCPLAGSSNASVSITVRYSITGSDVDTIYDVYRTQDNLRTNVLKPTVRDETRNACAKYTPFQVKEKRAALALDVEEFLTERWEKLGVIVDGVDLGDISLDKGTEEAERLHGNCSVGGAAQSRFSSLSPASASWS